MDSELTVHQGARKKGAEFEAMAAHFLTEQGAQIIARNFSCRCGEIDLIALLGGNVVFVEVRFRVSNDYGDPLESITFSKQRKLKKASQVFFQRNPHWDAWPCRFDVIAIYPASPPKPTTAKDVSSKLNTHLQRYVSHGTKVTNHYQIEWVCDAFQVDAW